MSYDSLLKIVQGTENLMFLSSVLKHLSCVLFLIKVLAHQRQQSSVKDILEI